MLNIPLDDERALSVEQFCEAEGLTKDAYRELQRIGLAPTEIWSTWYFYDSKLDNFDAVVRITPEERRRWHRQIRNDEFYTKQQAERDPRLREKNRLISAKAGHVVARPNDKEPIKTEPLNAKPESR